MALKIYRSRKYMTLSIPLNMDGKVFVAEFKGGRINPRVCGCFVTMDSEIQKALERESGFGKDFELEKTVDEPVSDRKQSGMNRTQDGGQWLQAAMNEQDEGTGQRPEAVKSERNAGISQPSALDGAEVVSGVARVQDAADYLSERYGISRVEVNTKAKIVAFIADRGIVFPNLNLGDGKKDADICRTGED